MTTEAQVSGYLTRVAAELPGPRRHRARILAELRDGLDHAVAAHTRTGLPSDQAVTAALDEFGSPHTVAEAFAPELAIAYARRTVAVFILTGPLVGIWWLLLLRPDPWRTGALALLLAIPVLPLIVAAALTAATTLATTGRLIRWLPETAPDRAILAVGTVAALVLLGDAGIIAVYAYSGGPLHPLAFLAILASLSRIVCGIVTIRHTIAWRARVRGTNG